MPFNCAVLCTVVKHSWKAYSYEQFLQVNYILFRFFDHPWSGVVYNFSWSCLYVCNLHVCQMITFEWLDVQSSYLHIWFIPRQYGSSSYVKVTRSRSRLKEQKSPQCIFPQGKTACQDNSASPQIENPIASNSTFITHTNDTAVEFACSI